MQALDAGLAPVQGRCFLLSDGGSNIQCLPFIFPMLASAVQLEDTGEGHKIVVESPQLGLPAVVKAGECLLSHSNPYSGGSCCPFTVLRWMSLSGQSY